MKNLLFALALFAGVAPAADPPNLGRVITWESVDPTTVVVFHEKGISIKHLDLKTLTVGTSYMVDTPPSFTSTWVDTSGVTQSVTTTSTGHSNAAVLTAIKNHKRAVALLQAAYPPMPPPMP
jgi:hypothetical protein